MHVLVPPSLTIINVDPGWLAGDDSGMEHTTAEPLGGTCPETAETAAAFLRTFAEAVSPGSGDHCQVSFIGDHPLPSAYAVSDFAAASIGAAAAQAAGLAADLATGLAADPLGEVVDVVVDRDRASLWFGFSLMPVGWELPAVWDPLAGDYRTSDGWIRLHTNAPHHRLAALTVLGVDATTATRDAVEQEVATWDSAALESAVVGAGGCAAAMRTTTEWNSHEQGRAVAVEPLLRWHPGTRAVDSRGATADPARPLAGVRVLDLTRVLAGPVATRFLAGLGADVLRIDPPGWDEAAVIPEVTLGKRCGRLDLRDAGDLVTLRTLLAGADIVVHGYRPGALDGLGLGSSARARLCPGLVDISLDAYGWSGPWARRRGFDSLVQMSCGIAAAGMAARGVERPVPLPVQALDHATGYLLAAAAISSWRRRLRTGVGSLATASLARTAASLIAGPAGSFNVTGPTSDGVAYTDESTGWGPARRLEFPARIHGVPIRWDRPANPLGSETAPLRWLDG